MMNRCQKADLHRRASVHCVRLSRKLPVDSRGTTPPPLRGNRGPRSSACLVVFAALAAGPACQRSAPGYFGTVAPRHPPTEIWVNNSTEPEWIDPGNCSDSAFGTLISNTMKVAITDASVVGVRALDDDRLEVRLENPVPYFLSLIMFYTAMPVPRHVIERLQAEGQNPDLWTRPEYFVSNGGYTLKEWKFRPHMVLEKDPYHWDAANHRPPR